MDDLMIKVDNVSKMYKLGQIGGTTLRDELQRLCAKRRREEDPTKQIGAKDCSRDETFMALNCVSFEVKKGERVGIIGHNGAGKSTLLKLLSRITAPTEGEIGLNGRVASMLEVGTGFHGELTGRENIYMNGAILGMTKKEIDTKMEDIIEFSECRQFIDTPVKRYSSGMYVKLAFSVAAHLDSEIMIMDEVLAVGDINFQQKCLLKMRQVAENEGRTILYVSHNMNTIKQLCDRCIVLNQGKIIYDGLVEKAINIYSNSNTEQVKKIYDVSRIIRKYETDGIASITFIKCNESEVNNGDNLSFELTIDSTKSIPELLLRFVVYSSSGQTIGTAYSQRFSLSIGNNSIVYLLNTNALAPDKYYVDIILCELNNNIQIRHDIILKTMPFVVVENEYKYNMRWLTSSWGNIMLPEIKVM